MITQKLSIAIIFCCVAALAFINSWSDQGNMSADIITASGTGIENDPVYMTGCQTHPRPIPPDIVYDPVVKNFVTLPCALEVPPPDAAIEREKRLPLK